jgi:hypothetical protein
LIAPSPHSQSEYSGQIPYCGQQHSHPVSPQAAPWCIVVLVR